MGRRLGMPEPWQVAQLEAERNRYMAEADSLRATVERLRGALERIAAVQSLGMTVNPKEIARASLSEGDDKEEA